MRKRDCAISATFSHVSDTPCSDLKGRAADPAVSHSVASPLPRFRLHCGCVPLFPALLVPYCMAFGQTSVLSRCVPVCCFPAASLSAKLRLCPVVSRHGLAETHGRARRRCTARPGRDARHGQAEMHGRARRRCTAGPGQSFQSYSSLFGVDAGIRVLENGCPWMAHFRRANSIFGVDAGVI